MHVRPTTGSRRAWVAGCVWSPHGTWLSEAKNARVRPPRSHAAHARASAGATGSERAARASEHENAVSSATNDCFGAAGSFLWARWSAACSCP